MMNGELAPISESCSEDVSSDGLHDMNDNACKKFIRSYLKGGFLKANPDRAKKCRDQLKRAGKLSTIEEQRVGCQILRHHFNKKSDVELTFFIEELVKVNVLEKDFFNFMRNLDSIEVEWRVQIFEALNEALKNSDRQGNELVLMISDNCHALLTMIDKHQAQLDKDLQKKLFNSCLRVLAFAFKEGLIFDQSRAKVDSILNLSKKAGVDNTFHFLIVKARSVHKFDDHNIEELKAAEALVSRARGLVEDPESLSELEELTKKLQDKRRIAEIASITPSHDSRSVSSQVSVQPPMSPSPSSRPCDSENSFPLETREVKKVKRKKKTKSYPRKDFVEDEHNDDSSSVDPTEPSTRISHGPPPQTWDFEINAVQTTETKNSDEMDELIDFMDSVSFLPTNYHNIHLSLLQAGLMNVQDHDLGATEALWSVMEPLAHKEKSWRLANVNFDDFKHRLDLRIPNWRESSKNLFNGVAEEFRVQIQLQSTFQPLIPNVTVSPCKGGHTTALCLLHTRAGRFRGLKQKTPTGFEFSPTVEPKPPAKRAGAGENELSPKIKEMIETASKLRRLQKKDDFSVKPSDEEKKNDLFYHMHKEAELKEMLSKEPANYIRCILRLQGPHEGLAEPVVDEQQPLRPGTFLPEEGVILRGRTKCGMAFEGDEVVVKLHRDAKGAVVSGEVVGVWSSRVHPVNQIFFCRVSADQANLMRPICSTVPKIHVANDPGLMHYEKKEAPQVQDLYNFHRNQGSATEHLEDRTKKQYGNQDHVSIFKVEMKEDNNLRFHDAKVEKVQRHTCNDVFVVIYKRWQPIHLYPYGYVIARLPANLSRADDVAVLRLQNNLPHPFGFDVAEEKAMEEAQRIASRPNSKAELQKREDFRHLPTVTIDNDDTVDMDDALSFRELDTGIFEVGVHITDAAHYIMRDSDLDKAARFRALTVYAKDLPAVHMLPSELSAKHLSLVAGEDRLCLCVLIRFSKQGDLMPFDKASDLKRSVIKSDHRLTKKIAAAALANENTEVPQLITEMLKRAHRCAQGMRSKRLLKQAATIELHEEDWPEPPSTYKVDQLVEELMVECNARIGAVLAEHFDAALFRVQPAPEAASVERWLAAHRDVARNSGTAMRWLELAGQALTDVGNQPGPLLSSEVKRQLEIAKKQKDVECAFKLLACEALHPQLYVALRAVWRASKNACYVPEQENHFSLNKPNYVHFTSPIRRYNDIVIQRLVHCVLDGILDPGISLKDLQEIAETCNERSTQMRHYERDLELLRLNWQAQAAPISLPCIIEDLASPRVLLDHPVVRKLGPGVRSVTDAQLNVRNLHRVENKLECTWEERLFIVDPHQRETHPNRRQPVSSRCLPQLQLLERQFRLGRVQPSAMPALPTLLRLLSGREGGFLLSSFTFEDVSSQAERVRDVTSEVRRLEDVNPAGSRAIGTQERKFVLDPSVTFQAKLRKFDCLRAQFGPARARERSPVISLVRLSPSFSLCLDHMTEPVLAFGQVCGTTIPREFHTLDDYQAAWLPVLRMESIAESIDDENAFHLAGVCVNWFQKDGNMVLGVFELPTDFCSNPHRQIQMNAEGALAACDEPGELDYVCVRVELDKYCWVGHGGITHTAKRDNPSRYVIAFRLNARSQSMPSEAWQKLASIEVIKKTMPKRRQERAVELLKTVPNSTAAAIAVGDFISNMRCHPFLKELTNKYFVSEGLFAARCNEYQKNAIKNAFTYAISLIWGPPGTGKTMTGVQITFWFAQYNKEMNDKPEEETKDSTDKGESDGDQEEQHDLEDAKSRYKDVWDSWKTVEKRPKRAQGSRPAFSRSPSSTRNLPASGRKGQSDEVLTVHFPSFKVRDPEPIRLEERRRQVLYCGPSNACVNCVAEHIRTKVVPDYLSIVRVFSEQVEAKEFRVPGEDISCSRFESDVEVPENLLEVSLHRLIRLPDRPYAEMLAAFDKGFKSVCSFLDGKTKYSRLEVVIDRNPQASEVSESMKPQLQRIMEGIRLAALNYHSLLVIAKSTEIRKHDVVLCTTAVSSNLILQNNCRFCQVIIDEAGMCTEPETLVPLVPAAESSASAAVENVVLIGDYKQLRPILKNNIAAELGLQHSMLERHWEGSRGPDRSHRSNCVMLKRQYRMHPSLCEFPSQKLYYGKLSTGVSSMWTSLEFDDIKIGLYKQWSGLNMRFVARNYYPQVLENGNANVLHGTWPGVRREEYRCLEAAVDEEYGEEERIIFLHVEGKEENQTHRTAKGSENSKCNQQEIDEVVRIYMEMRKRFSQPRNALGAIAVLSQYQLQVNEIRERLSWKLSDTQKKEAVGTTAKKFLQRQDKFRRKAEPIVTSVVQSQGSEFDYVILSTVRSLPTHDINHSPTPGWEKKYLGFITDINQVNVALTRARKGLIIIGNGELLKVHKFWKDLIENLKDRDCYVANSKSFSPVKNLRSTEFPKAVRDPYGYDRSRDSRSFQLGGYLPDQASHRGGYTNNQNRSRGDHHSRGSFRGDDSSQSSYRGEHNTRDSYQGGPGRGQGGVGRDNRTDSRGRRVALQSSGRGGRGQVGRGGLSRGGAVRRDSNDF